MIPSEQARHRFDEFVHSLCDTKLRIRIEVEAEIANLPVFLDIKCNETCLKKQQITAGKHCIDLDHDTINTNESVISIAMLGKNSRDTVVREGKIIKDTWIQLKKLEINNFQLLEDYDFFHANFKYYNIDDAVEEPVKMGFWRNSSLSLSFENPFDLWYQKKTKKNIRLHSNLKHRQDEGMPVAKQELIESLNLLDR